MRFFVIRQIDGVIHDFTGPIRARLWALLKGLARAARNDHENHLGGSLDCRAKLGVFPEYLPMPQLIHAEQGSPKNAHLRNYQITRLWNLKLSMSSNL